MSKLHVGDSCVVSIQSLKTQNKKRNKTMLLNQIWKSFQPKMKMKKWKPSSQTLHFSAPKSF
jgi:hypothetical protein